MCLQFDAGYQRRQSRFAPGYQYPGQRVVQHIGRRASVAASRSRVVIDDQLAFSCGYCYGINCSWSVTPPRYFRTNGDFDIYDYRFLEDRRRNDQLQAILQGYLATGKIRHNLTLGASMLRCIMSQSDSVNVVVGSDYIYSPNPIVYEPSSYTPGALYLRLDGRQKVLFAVDCISLTPQWQLIAGVRNVWGGERAPDNTGAATRTTDKTLLLPQSDLSLYTSHSKGLTMGWQAPWWNEHTYAFLPSTVSHQIEAGIKYDWRDRLSLSATIFRMSKPYDISETGRKWLQLYLAEHGNPQGYQIQHRRLGQQAIATSVAFIQAQENDTGTPAYDDHQVINAPHLCTAYYALVAVVRLLVLMGNTGMTEVDSDSEPGAVAGTKLQPVLSHGMGLEVVAPSWPALTLHEVALLLRHYPQVGAVTRLEWHSPRPFSSACVADTESGPMFVKRLLREIRTADELTQEHRFMAHLRQRGLAVSVVLHTADGRSAYADGEWTYEVHRLGQGVDRYRDATSWTAFTNCADAAAAGAALARLHLAARGYDAPARSVKLLASGFTLFHADAPQEVLSRMQHYIEQRPALADYLMARDWRQDVTQVLLPFHAQLSTLLQDLQPLWTHNDWHASNLLWQGTRTLPAVATIVDFGLSDRTCAVYDLAIAIERNIIEWLALPQQQPDNQRPLVHIDQLDAMLDAYQELAPLSAIEAQALSAVLPLAHAEFALSELAYFHGVQKSVENASLAYDTYFLGHAEWFNSDAGRYLLAHLRHWAARLVNPKGS